MKTSYVYLLRSIKDGKFYVGWTTDLKRRLEEHNAGLTRSTKSRRPFELIHDETYPSPELAKKRESTLKRCPRILQLFKKRALKRGARGATGDSAISGEVVGGPTTSDGVVG